MKHFRDLPYDLETNRKILQLFHPSLIVNDEQLEKMCNRGSYSWMCIEGNVKYYGYVHICIDNGHDTFGLYGGGHNIQVFEKYQHALVFNAWRITNDCRYFPFFSDREVLSKKIHDIMIASGYRTKTAAEWYKEYYSE